MFAHCLLPAVLLLAAIDYCTTFKPYNDFQSVVYKGLSDTTFNVGANYTIPSKQCYGILHKSVFPQCSGKLSKVLAMKVGIIDPQRNPQVVIPDNLNEAVVKRQPPCEGLAVVQAQLRCKLPEEEDSELEGPSRRLLPPIQIIINS